MRGEDVFQRGVHRGQCGIIQRGLRVGGGVSGRKQQAVALPEWKIQRLRQAYDDFPARLRPAAFQEADVPLGGPRSQGEFELAEAAEGPALA